MSVKEVLAQNPKLVFEKHFPELAGKTGQQVVLCPFHEDKNPSFSINLDSGLYNCFSCGETGNHLTFIKKFNNYSIIERPSKINSITKAQNGKPKPEPKVHIRKIGISPKSFRFVFKTIKEAELREATLDDIHQIEILLEKEYSLRTFKMLSKSIKISQNPYGIAFLCGSENFFFNPGKKEEILSLEGRTDFLSAIECGFHNNFGVLSRYNKAKQIILDGKPTYIVMDSDDTLEKILERIKIEAETEVWIGKPPKKFGDFSDWAFASRDLLKIETFIEHFKNEAHHEVFKKEIDKEKVSTSKTNTFHDRAFAREFNEKYEIKLYNSLFFQFNNGHYEEISKREIQHWIGEELEEIDPILAKASRMRDVFFQLEGFLDEIEEQDKTKINLKNGLYDLENEELIPHSKKFFHVNQIPYEYNPKAKPKMLLEWLNYAFDKENCKEEIIQSIQRFFGYCLLPACNEQKALWLVGIAESGKSKLAQLLCSLLGEVNTATLEILALKDKFGLAEIVNKKLIWMDEIDSSALSAIAESRLKSAISNNPIGVEKKGVDRVSLVPNAKWIFSTNKLPRFNDKSDGIYRRFIFLPFRNAIKRENVNPNFLQELLEKEASGILNWAIEGAKSYLEKGLIEPTASKQLKESHKSDSNPLADFVEEYLEIGNNGEISSTKLKELYSEYAEENGYRDQNVRSILKSIKEMFWHIKFDKRKSNGTTYYWNISIRIDKV